MRAGRTAGLGAGERRVSGVLDLNDIVDGQRMRGWTILLVAVAMLILISDGFDLAAMGYVAPELVKSWHIQPARLVPAFSAGIIGMMIGGPLFGVLGDRYGRKRLIIAGLCAIGAFTLATMAVRSITDLVVLRFLTGLGLGGVIPNVVALVAEVSPRRIRGRLLVIISLGVAIGIALPGLVAATLVAQFGWRVLLLVGGVLPLAVAAASLFLVPESIKYLILRGNRDAEVRRLARRLRPDLTIDETTRFAVPIVPVRRAGGARLFAGDFRFVTPLLWIVQAANQMANFFSLTWLPLLLQATGSSTAQAGVAASLFSVGGLAGGLVLMFIIDRLGVIPLVLLFVAGAPLVAAMGISGISFGAHAAIIAAAGLCVVGIQFGTTAVLGLFYPTEIRSMGTGWTQAAGRIGALAAPVAGGILLDLHFTIQDLLFAPAIAMGIGGVACAALSVIALRRFGSLRPQEFSTAAAAPSAYPAEARSERVAIGASSPAI